MQEASFLQGFLLLVSTFWFSHASYFGNSFSRSVLVSIIAGQCEPVPLQTQLSCFTRKYRTFDGKCNNLCNVSWGSALRPLKRLLPSAYQDSKQAPRSLGTNKQPLPNARNVSKTVFVSSKVNEDNANPPSFTHMTMTWGQFFGHDIVLTQKNESVLCGDNNLPCKGPKEGCIGIDVLPGNELETNRKAVCMPLKRSAIKNGEQVNSVSAFIDGSQIYGGNYEEAERLRDRRANLGLLRVLPFPGSSIKSPILPKAEPESYCRSQDPSRKPCLLAGDYRRVNENPALMAMHTVWVREHNRIANYLHILNPTWRDERLFQEARKIVIAELQHITYNEWVPVFFNEKLREHAHILLKPAGQFYDDYDSSVNVEIMNCFATAAQRMGHSLVRDEFGKFNKQLRHSGNIQTKGAFFDPTPLYSKSRGDGIGEILLGLVSQASQNVDRFFSPAVRENLLTPGPTIDGIVGDLSAINIQRGRDHGLPPYNQFRNAGGLGLAASIDNLTNIDQAQRERLRVAYNNNVDDIDLYVGGMSETPLPGSILGNTFSYILAKSLMNLRAGDRFWYERNDSYIGFTMGQLNAIRNASLARVLCDNTEQIKRIYPNVFRVKSTVNCLSDCINLKVVDLNEWKEDESTFYYSV